MKHATIKMKAAALREGDKIIDPTSGDTYVVKANTKTKRTIPKKEVKMSHLVLENKRKVNGRNTRGTEVGSYFSDDEFDVLPRKDLASRTSYLIEDMHKPTIACAVAGCFVTMAVGLIPGMEPMVLAGMLGSTVVASVFTFVNRKG
jgi:hypothetical protein